MEALLLAADVITFLVVVMWLPTSVRWINLLPPVAVLIAIAHTMVEGSRWQMIPAYALTGLIFLIWLRRKFFPKGKSARRKPIKRLVCGLAVGLGTTGLVISIILPVALPVFHFPSPRGPYEIGTTTYHWTDAGRREISSSDPDSRRELMVQVWYPSKKSAPNPHAPYLHDAGAVTSAVARLHDLPDFALRQLEYVTTNAVESAPAADNERNYPVLISPVGLTGYRQMNTFQIEELVSQGYIVVGIDQPGAAAVVVFPDGHQIAGLSKTQMDPLVQQSVSPVEDAPVFGGQVFKDGVVSYFAQDVEFTLDKLSAVNESDPNNILTGKMDLLRTGMFGVSFGGIVGAETCSKDPRLKACLMEDVVMPAGVVQNGLRQPSMWITRPADTMRLERQESGGWTDKDIEQTQTTMRAVYNGLSGSGYFVQVPGMFHVDLTDITYISPIFPIVGFSGPIGVQRAHDIVNSYSVDFFNEQLKGQSPRLLDGRSIQYSDVLFESRGPRS